MKKRLQPLTATQIRSATWTTNKTVRDRALLPQVTRCKSKNRHLFELSLQNWSHLNQWFEITQSNVLLTLLCSLNLLQNSHHPRASQTKTFLNKRSSRHSPSPSLSHPRLMFPSQNRNAHSGATRLNRRQRTNNNKYPSQPPLSDSISHRNQSTTRSHLTKRSLKWMI
jgi:hypothetical protein